MEIHKALDQIAGIHEHLARTNVFGGYRPLILFSIGVLGYAAAFLQPVLIPSHSDTPIGFTAYWTVVAILGGAAGVAMMGYYNWRARDIRVWRQTMTIVFQTAPALVCGGLVAIVFSAVLPEAAAFLPGVWALFLGQGVIAARPYLTESTGYVGLFYFAAGAALLALAEPGVIPSPWTMGLTFGTGHLLAALIFYLHERNADGHA